MQVELKICTHWVHTRLCFRCVCVCGYCSCGLPYVYWYAQWAPQPVDMTGSDGWCLTLDSAVSGELLLLIHFLQTSAHVRVSVWIFHGNIATFLEFQSSINKFNLNPSQQTWWTKRRNVVHGDRYYIKLILWSMLSFFFLSGIAFSSQWVVQLDGIELQEFSSICLYNVIRGFLDPIASEWQNFSCSEI